MLQLWYHLKPFYRPPHSTYYKSDNTLHRRGVWPPKAKSSLEWFLNGYGNETLVRILPMVIYTNTRFNCRVYNIIRIPYSGKVQRGESLANWLFSRIWQKKVWRINRLANRLLIVSTKLDSLVNHWWFAKIAKLSRYTVSNKSFVLGK